MGTVFKDYNGQTIAPEIMQASQNVLAEHDITSGNYSSLDQILDDAALYSNDRSRYRRLRASLNRTSDTASRIELGLLNDFFLVQAAEVFHGKKRIMTDHNYIWHQLDIELILNNLYNWPITPEGKRSFGIIHAGVKAHDTPEELGDARYAEFKNRRLEELDIELHQPKNRFTKNEIKKYLELRVDESGNIRSEIRKQEMARFARMGRDYISAISGLDSELDKNYMHAALDRIIATTGKVTRGRQKLTQRPNFLTSIRAFDLPTTDAKIQSSALDSLYAYVVKLGDRVSNLFTELPSGEQKLLMSPEKVKNPDNLRKATENLTVEELEKKYGQLKDSYDSWVSSGKKKSEYLNLYTELQKQFAQEGEWMQNVFENEDLHVRSKVSRTEDLMWAYLIADRAFNKLRKVYSLPESRRDNIDDWVMDTTNKVALGAMKYTSEVARLELLNHIVHNNVGINDMRRYQRFVSEYMTIRNADGELFSEKFSTTKEREELPEHLQHIDLFMDDIQRLAKKDTQRQRILDEDLYLLFSKAELTRRLADKSWDRNIDVQDYSKLYSIKGELPKTA